MPKRNRPSNDVEYIEGREHLEPPDPAEESYSAFITKWGREGAKVRVYRVTPQGKQYCFLGTPEEIDPESLRLFHAKQSYAHETGSYLIEIEVNGEVRSPFPVLIAPQTNAPGIPEQSGSSGGAMSEMMRLLMAQNERLERLAMAANKTPLNEMADTLMKLDQLRGGGGNGTQMDTLMKAVELGQKLNGSGDTDTWLGLVKEVAPHVAPLLGQIAARLGAGQNGGGEAVNEEVILKQGVGYLKKKALAGSDPLLYVDIVIDNREEPLYAKLIHRILENDFSAFASIDPEISRPEYEPFFRSIYDGIRSAFIPTDSMEVDTSGAGGNNRNTKPDGKAGKGGGKKS